MSSDHLWDQSHSSIGTSKYDVENWDPYENFEYRTNNVRFFWGWDICKNKWGSEIDNFIFILTWSGPHSTRVALRCPNWLLTNVVKPWEALRGPELSQLGCPDHSASSQGISRPLWCCEDHFRSVWICICLFRTPVLFCKYLSPLRLHKIGSVFKIYIWISVFRKKNGLEICSLVPEILDKQTFWRFFLNAL